MDFQNPFDSYLVSGIYAPVLGHDGGSFDAVVLLSNAKNRSAVNRVRWTSDDE